MSVCTSNIDSDTSLNESRKPIFIDPKTTLKCHRREYTYNAVKTDEYGRRCRDKITVMSCWGRCESGEITYHLFPYKKSYHPTCMPDATETTTVMLRNCDAGVSSDLMEYRYVEALSCKCQFCQSSIASCEEFLSLGTRAP
ncbi:glycoprotein hormone beta 5-like protein [Leptotrombidium deliense]|uniref:Glycoprotein hormone beta 5-like protein n=1 Tax=Leptotrombidium deliense TaxID=299467 RepID=A0A443SV87_9ACAR|nr:glycoprotein hormone beta 5-like protein [Leptotrombidium deliense]